MTCLQTGIGSSTDAVLDAPYPCLNVLKLRYAGLSLCISCLAHSLPCRCSPSPLPSICHALLSPACKKWFALLRLHETPLLHNTDALAQGLPRGPSGRGPGRAVVGVWAAPIKVAQDLPWPGPAQASIKRHWLVENGSLGRRYRLKPAWSPCCF